MNEIFVVKTDNIDETTYNKLLTFLTPEEKKRTSRKNSHIGTILAKYALSKVFGLKFEEIKFSRTKNGKPYLENYDNIHFSISHSQNVVVCAIADKPVGIDVQIIKPVSDAVINRVCSKSEIEEIINSKDPVSSFIRTFTKKEAILKKKGTGIIDKDIKSCISSQDTHSQKFENYWISCTL